MMVFLPNEVLIQKSGDERACRQARKNPIARLPGVARKGRRATPKKSGVARRVARPERGDSQLFSASNQTSISFLVFEQQHFNFFSVLRCSRISQHTTFLLSFIGYKTNHLYFISNYHISFKINIQKLEFILNQSIMYAL